jgi:7-cyano-7-deazaguanine synthase
LDEVVQITARRFNTMIPSPSSSCSSDMLVGCRRAPAKSPLLLYSGGLDSTVLLYEMRPAACVFFDYGQTHAKEKDKARWHCDKKRIPFHVLTLPPLQGSSLTGGNGTFIVPVRNLIFLALAANFAIANGHDQITIGANATDRDLFPDCRLGFLENVRLAITGSGYDLRVEAPLLNMTKSDIAERAITLGIRRSSVWSCYAGGDVPCGVCGACKAEEGVW